MKNYLQKLEAAKFESVAQMLFKCARLWNEQAIELVRERTGISTLRPAHTQLFPHIEFEGTRLTELARRIGISKQAVAQLVQELEDVGCLERIPDPVDKRAKLIRFTRDGQHWLLSGLSMLNQMEQRFQAELGKETMDVFHCTLFKLLDILEKEE